MRKALTLCMALVIGSSALSQLRVDVALVDVVATVMDERGRYVPDLVAEDFILEEDGVQQAIAHVTPSNNLPVSMGVLLDVSLSMRMRIETAVSAIDRFIRSTHKDDDIFLMAFSDRSMLLQGFTSDRNKLTAALRRAQLVRDTALFDAIDDALLHVQRGIHKKRAILLVTDGEESGASADTYQEALANIRQDDVLIYSLGIGQPSSETPFGRPQPQRSPARGFAAGQRTAGSAADGVNMAVLQEFAEASGGQSWLIRDEAREMERILDIIASELRNQYTIDYYPTRAIKDGKWHRVELRTRNSRYTVRARKDYFGD